MRRFVSALVLVLLALALLAPAAEAGTAAPSESLWSWFQQIIDTVSAAMAGGEMGSGPNSAAPGAPSGPDLGPDMDPDG